jgi:uncharacterized protein
VPVVHLTSEGVRLAVLSDTHLRAGDLARLPAGARRAMEEADLVLHAGDVVTAGALSALGTLAEVRAVLGNNDLDLVGVVPEVAVEDLGGVTVAMVHDAGRREGRAARLHRRFPDAQVVVFGHSHVPCDEVGIGGQLLFNPGSPTQRRAQPTPTIGLLELDGGRVVRRAIVPV